MRIMKKIIKSFVILLLVSTAIQAQDYKSAIAERKALSKYATAELNEKASKAAKKEAKSYIKEGWLVAPGHLPLEKQLDRTYQMQYEFDDLGYPKYLMSEAMSIGATYDAAKLQAIELARLTLAGQLQSEVIALVENEVANEQLSNEQAASVTETVIAGKNLISQKLGKVITIIECYREKNNGNKEVRVMIAYNTDMAIEAAKNAVVEELKKKGDELHEKLDGLLNL